MSFPARRPARQGTRFRVYPQFDEGYGAPEEIVVALPPGLIGPGPSDPWMYVANAREKSEPYAPPSYLPPYGGALYPPATADRNGDFDRIPLDAPQFRAAHAYAVVRRTLDIWEGYLGRRIAWWFAPQFPRLELGPMVAFDNAQSGPGFLEAGRHPNADGSVAPYWANFDVLAHETGHLTLFSTVGVPDAGSVHGAFLAFHEAFADMFAVNAALQFRSVRLKLLGETGGNLYATNLVTRIAELTTSAQIRIVSNDMVMADVDGLRLGPDGSWVDPTGQDRGVFALSAPLVGAMFDCLVEVYQDGLVARGLIPDEKGPTGWTPAEAAASLARVQDESARAFARFADGFEATLDYARDAIGLCMAHVMRTIRPDTLTFARVAAGMIDGAGKLGLGQVVPELLQRFIARGIDPRPHLAGRADERRRGRAPPRPRPAAERRPQARPACAGCSLHPGFLLAGGLLSHEHRGEPMRAWRR